MRLPRSAPRFCDFPYGFLKTATMMATSPMATIAAPSWRLDEAKAPQTAR